LTTSKCQVYVSVCIRLREYPLAYTPNFQARFTYAPDYIAVSIAPAYFLLLALGGVLFF
jgi:hypothetical protein